MNQQLSDRIAVVERRILRLRLLHYLTCLMLILGVASWLTIEPIKGHRFAPSEAVAVLGLLGVFTTVVLLLVVKLHRFPREVVAARVEEIFPDLDQRLLTAVGIREENLGYLESELIREAVSHADAHEWARVVPRNRMRYARILLVASTLFCLSSFWNTYRKPFLVVEVEAIEGAIHSSDVVLIEPGDVELESGTSLVVTARYSDDAPDQATLVVEYEDGAHTSHVMKRNLSDPVLGVVISDVNRSFRYRVIDGDWESVVYQASTYKRPELIQSDAKVTYPAYTKLPTRRIENTVRVSAVEGSTVQWTCLLNKPVSQAVLHDEKSDERIALLQDANQPDFYGAEVRLDRTKRYTLHLEDQEGRTNRFPPELVARMITNEPAKLKATIAGDAAVSPLEEYPVAAQVVDDFGVIQFGLTYTFGSSDSMDIVLGRQIPKGAKETGEYLIAFEDLTAAPDDLLTYHFWAEDHAPDGSIRRNEGDLYFAEVRAFDEIYRESSQQQAAAQSEQSNQESANGQQAEELANLQKEIINATWRLLRDQDQRAEEEAFVNDIQLVIDSQNEAINQVREMSAEVTDERSQRFVDLAINSMGAAVETLQEIKADPGSTSLRTALQSETQAYSSLLKLRAREFEITQMQQQPSSSSSSSSSSQNRRQQQLDELELEQEEERYETESQAMQSEAQQSEERETRQVLNRLRDLARRQQDLNDAIAELQSSLDAAEDRDEKEELDRQLKRLREQQQDLLRETDELSERVQQNADQQQMSEAVERLEQTREQVREAAEQLEQNNAAEALTAGRRAEREFEQMRDEFRQSASGQFNERIRELNQQAEQLSERQQKISEQMQPTRAKPDNLGLRAEGEDRQQTVEDLRQQAEELEGLLERMQETVEQAEDAEPLLAQRLYDTFRETSQRQTQRQLEESANLLERGFEPQSQELETAAADGIEALQEGLRRASESVLGDETRALQSALSELEQLEAELRREMDLNDPESNDASGQPTDPSEQPSEAQGQQTEGQGQQAQQPGQQSGQQPAQQSGQQPAQQSGQQPAQQSGQQPAQQSGQQPAQQSGQQPSVQGAGEAQGQSGGEGSAENGSPASAGSVLNQLASGNPAGNPLTGDGFRDWTDRLRDVEEMVTDPDLRSNAAQIRDRAREIRRESRRLSREPQWDLVEEMIATPLRELKKRVSDELMRQSAEKNAIVPLDRDPVPERYQDAVRDYYERLGSGS